MALGQTYLPEINVWDGSNRWHFKHDGNQLNLNVSRDLAEAMKTNPRLKVMLNGGYYDLATPFFGAEYEEKHLPIPASLAKNIEYDWYESGTPGVCARRDPETAARPRGGVYQRCFGGASGQ
jgi:carboxypeptidase C (cathepsin A)